MRPGLHLTVTSQIKPYFILRLRRPCAVRVPASSNLRRPGSGAFVRPFVRSSVRNDPKRKKNGPKRSETPKKRSETVQNDPNTVRNGPKRPQNARKRSENVTCHFSQNFGKRPGIWAYSTADQTKSRDVYQNSSKSGVWILDMMI